MSTNRITIMSQRFLILVASITLVSCGSQNVKMAEKVKQEPEAKTSTIDEDTKWGWAQVHVEKLLQASAKTEESRVKEIGLRLPATLY